MKRLILTAVFLATVLLAGNPAQAGGRRYTVRVGPTWDTYLASGFARGMQQSALRRNLYRQYRDQVELVNRERIDKGLEPLKLKNYQEWRRCP